MSKIRLSESRVREIKKLYEEGKNKVEIAKTFNCDMPEIDAACHTPFYKLFPKQPLIEGQKKNEASNKGGIFFAKFWLNNLSSDVPFSMNEMKLLKDAIEQGFSLSEDEHIQKRLAITEKLGVRLENNNSQISVKKETEEQSQQQDPAEKEEYLIETNGGRSRKTFKGYNEENRNLVQRAKRPGWF